MNDLNDRTIIAYNRPSSKDRKAASKSFRDRSILARLKCETQGSHISLESRIDLMNRVRTIGSYKVLLETLYSLYCPLEAEIQRSRSEIALWLPDVDDRMMRTASLRSDLQAIGNSRPEALPLAPIPPLRSLAEQFGCLYVLEGSTLGGQIISRHIGTYLHYTQANGCAFFASYGPEIGSMWRRFRDAIERFAAFCSAEHHDEIVHSATRTFEAFSFWIERSL